MSLSQTIVARAGVKHLQELQKVLGKQRVSSSIVCPPDADTNH